MADNASLAGSLYQAWNDRDLDAIADATAADGELVVVGSGDTYRGPEGVRQYNTMWANAFPDGTITVDRIISAGDTVVVQLTGRGTHTGDLVTPTSTIPATGKSATLQLCDVLVFEQGKVRTQHTYFDGASLLAQLGLLEQQPTTQLSAGE